MCSKKSQVSDAVFEPSLEDFEKISEKYEDCSMKPRVGRVGKRQLEFNEQNKTALIPRRSLESGMDLTISYTSLFFCCLFLKSFILSLL